MAASTRVTYNAGAAAGGVHVANAARYATLAKQEIARAKAVADSVSAGGVTPANLEGSSEFGAGVGGGAALYTAIADLSTNLNTVTTSQLANLDQGG